jgi:hypothetical protein
LRNCEVRNERFELQVYKSNLGKFGFEIKWEAESIFTVYTGALMKKAAELGLLNDTNEFSEIEGGDERAERKG